MTTKARRKKLPKKNERGLGELGGFIHLTRYSRFLKQEERRETYEETVDRFVNFMTSHLKKNFGEKCDLLPQFLIIREKILAGELMPSMRLMWSAGQAVTEHNACAYNCAFLAVDSIESFSEALHNLMCGAGVGYSVEQKEVDKLPVVSKTRTSGFSIQVISDDKEGWADSVKLLMRALYDGSNIVFDYGKIRPAGAVLNTMGGRASGPEPLINLHNFIRMVFNQAQGRKLKRIECHHIMCMIAEIVVVGGVRRSALICLSDLDDEEIANCKNWRVDPECFVKSPHLGRANISAVYEKMPTEEEFKKEWQILRESGSGERGIFNRESFLKKMDARRLQHKADMEAQGYNMTLGTNPCGEILLFNRQFCNLSEVVVKPGMTEEELYHNAKLAAIIGTIQSTFTDFKYLSDQWKKNCEGERLLGVSLTGQYDNVELLTPEVLNKTREAAIEGNKIASKILGINESHAVTCVKPSGTVSLLIDAASGAHPRHSKYYIRRAQLDPKDPVVRMLEDQGAPVYKGKAPGANYYVIDFPVKAPENAVVRKDLDAISHIQHWLNLKQNYCDHNPSITISVREDEWDKVGQFVYENFEDVGGLSFFPMDDAVYVDQPLTEITKDEYEKLVRNFPKLDFSKLPEYENSDNTSGSRSYSCTGGKCEL